MVLRHALTDARFTVTHEYHGARSPGYVLRFCGEWIAAFPTQREADTARADAIKARNAELDHDHE